MGKGQGIEGQELMFSRPLHCGRAANKIPSRMFIVKVFQLPLRKLQEPSSCQNQRFKSSELITSHSL